jgi:hypothetical protein
MTKKSIPQKQGEQMIDLKEWIKQCTKAQEILVNRLQGRENDPVLFRCLSMLNSLRDEALQSWPPAGSAIDNNKLGWYSARNIEEIDPELDEILSRISNQFNNAK